MTVITSNTVSTTVSQENSYTCYIGRCETILDATVCIPEKITQNKPCDGLTSFNTAQEACANARCSQ